MIKDWTLSKKICKPLLMCSAIALLAGCSTNAATGRTQFAGLMSPQQETQVGASEHEKIVKQFGLYKNSKLQSYVTEIGKRVSVNTERADVQYKFFVLDSPIVNAFALPGGYVYISRGLMALSNSEAELAGVLAHEIGHVTARHSAERYSHGVVTSLGAAVIAAAVDSTGVSQALGLGSNLYMSSYSRSQENEADSLGIRYLSKGGYEPKAMSSFLNAMQNQSAVDSKAKGEKSGGANYFSTHPATADRVAKTRNESAQYKAGGDWDRDKYLKMIDGMTYGDSAEQGFAKGQTFYHPQMKFAFTAPNGFEIVNQPSQVIAVSKASGAAMIFDMSASQGAPNPASYISNVWMKGKSGIGSVENTTVNGMPAASVAFPGEVNGKKATIRVMAVQWAADRYARFQIAIPNGSNANLVNSLKTASYSLRKLSNSEVQKLKPNTVRVIAAKSGESVSGLARRSAFSNLQEERFRVLNGLGQNDQLQAGRLYKVIVD